MNEHEGTPDGILSISNVMSDLEKMPLPDNLKNWNQVMEFRVEEYAEPFQIIVENGQIQVVRNNRRKPNIIFYGKEVQVMKYFLDTTEVLIYTGEKIKGAAQRGAFRGHAILFLKGKSEQISTALNDLSISEFVVYGKVLVKYNLLSDAIPPNLDAVEKIFPRECISPDKENSDVVITIDWGLVKTTRHDDLHFYNGHDAIGQVILTDQKTNRIQKSETFVVFNKAPILYRPDWPVDAVVDYIKSRMVNFNCTVCGHENYIGKQTCESCGRIFTFEDNEKAKENIRNKKTHLTIETNEKKSSFFWVFTMCVDVLATLRIVSYFFPIFTSRGNPSPICVGAFDFFLFLFAISLSVGLYKDYKKNKELANGLKKRAS